MALRLGVPAPRPIPGEGPAQIASRRPRRALVTGASGFIGRHLARRLLATGWEVTVVVRSTSRLPADLAERCLLIDAESPFEEFANAVASVSPEACFHLATHFSNERGGADIASLLDSNISFGTRLLEALDRSGPVDFVYSGSRMQHFDGEVFRPVSLYSATKQAFGDIMKYYADVRSMSMATIEFPDTYGSDDPRRKLLSLLRDAAATGEPLHMSPGQQLVEVLHVSDAVDALLAAQAVATTAAESYSATGTTVPLREFVRAVEAAWDVRIPIAWGSRAYRDREMMTPWVHWPAVPGWAQRISLGDGLRELLMAPALEVGQPHHPLHRSATPVSAT